MSRRARRWLPAAQIAVGLSLVVGLARADPPEALPYLVTYAAPVVCPGEEWFLAAVASHVQDASRARSVRVNVRVEERGPGYLGTVVAFDPSGRESSRRIEDRKCADVVRALVLMTALVIELGGHVEPEALATSHPPPSPVPPSSPVERAAPARPRSIALSAVLLGGVRGGLGPAARASAELGVDAGAPATLLAPSVRVSGFVANGSLDGVDGSATLWLFGGRLELCSLRLGNARFAVRPCLGAELGVVHAEGQIAFAPRVANEPWISVEATLRAQWFATSSWFVELSGGPVVPLDRTRYYFEPDRTLYVVPGLTGRAAVGAGLLF